MRREGNKELIPFDYEIEKTSRKNRKEKREASRQLQDTIVVAQKEIIEKNWALHDYALPVVNETLSGIRRPAI